MWRQTTLLQTTFKCCQRLQLLAGINSCSDNASRVFNRRQIWRILWPIFLWSEMSNVVFSTRWLALLMCLRKRRPAETIHHNCSKTALSQYMIANCCATECMDALLFQVFRWCSISNRNQHKFSEEWCKVLLTLLQ